MMNCFPGMVDERLLALFPAHNKSSGLVGKTCADVITTKPRRFYSYKKAICIKCWTDGFATSNPIFSECSF